MSEHHQPLRHTCHRCGAYASDDQLRIETGPDERLYYVHREACS
jgi:putative component of toxin-antitoxin plasmid stabilization module